MTVKNQRNKQGKPIVSNQAGDPAWFYLTYNFSFMKSIVNILLLTCCVTVLEGLLAYCCCFRRAGGTSSSVMLRIEAAGMKPLYQQNYLLKIKTSLGAWAQAGSSCSIPAEDDTVLIPDPTLMEVVDRK